MKHSWFSFYVFLLFLYRSILCIYIYINWNLKFVTIYISVYFEKIHKNKIINNDINLTIFFCKQCFINGVISNASLADKGEIMWRQENGLSKNYFEGSFHFICLSVGVSLFLNKPLQYIWVELQYNSSTL
jgi:hypothetical protein